MTREWVHYQLTNFGLRGAKISLPKLGILRDRAPKADNLRPKLKLAMGMISGWHASEFEREAETTYTLRAWYLDDGLAWAAADEAARRIVSRAFKMLDIIRPSWREGQRYATAPSGCCWECGGELTDAQQLQRFNFCGPTCTNKAYARERQHGAEGDKFVKYMCSRELGRHQYRTQTCRHCQTEFQPHYGHEDRQNIYCSNACKYEAMTVLPEVPCLWCGEIYKQLRAEQKYCSHKCQGLHTVAEFRKTAPEKSCPACKGIFRQTGAVAQVYCSPQCARSPEVRRQEYLKRRVLQPITERDCQWCSKTFLPPAGKHAAKFCCAECQIEAKKARDCARMAEKRAAKIARLTPSIFDHLFAEAA